MSTYKRTGLDGVDYAFPSKPILPPPLPKPVPPCPPPPPYDWGGFPYYPPYPEMDAEPVPTPPIPGRFGPIPPVPPPPFPPVPPCPPCPPYPPPKPEKVDECSKKLAKLSAKAKVLVQMIKDFEKKNKPAILTIGPNSYQFGTEMITDFGGEPAKGMYAGLISGEPIPEFDPNEIVIDESGTRVSVKNPVDLLQTELARVRKEITLVAAKLNDEVSEEEHASEALVPGTDENH